MKILLLDNYDSFTYNLYDYILRLGADCQVFRNDEISLSELKQKRFDALLISPGPKRPADAGITMEVIDFYVFKYPILGVCLGHQALGEYFGANLLKAALPMHGKTSAIFHAQKSIFKGLPSPFWVMRYHSLLLKDLPDCLEPLAATEGGELMAMQHHELPMLGVQFHPESILTEYGLSLIFNWLSTIPIQKQYFFSPKIGAKNTFTKLVE